MIAAHFEAVRALIAGAEGGDLHDKGHDAARVDTNGKLIRDTYWILFGGGPEVLDDDRLSKAADAASTATYIYVLRAVSITAEGARRITETATGRLAGAVLGIEGRKVDPLGLTSDRVETDNSINPPLYYCDTEITAISRRA